MKFIFQNGVKFLDNQYLLEQAKEYWNFRNSGKPEESWTKIEIIHESEGYSEDPKVLCPVGTVEWTVAWYSRVWGKCPKPKNIPPELYSYFPGLIYSSPAGETHPYKVLHVSDSILSLFQKHWMVKSANTIKAGLNGKYSSNELGALVELYQPEDLIMTSWIPDILSEWRCFVYKGELLDAKCYTWLESPFEGIPRNVPDMIQSYESSGKAPIAYTLDVGVRKDGITFPLEVHDFFSCGLYGFDDLEKFPFMLYRWFREYTI